MKYPLLLLFLIPIYLIAEENTLLFLPREDHPFILNSTTGNFTIEEKEEPWPQVLTINTEGDGKNVQVAAHGLPSFSLEGGNLVIWVKMDNLDALKEFWIYAADGSDFANRIVYMPSNDKSQLREGVWTRLSMPLTGGSVWGSPDLAKLDTVQFWLNDRGTDPVTVQLGPVYLEDAEEESAVIMTFDDGWKSQLETAAPIMAGLGLKGTAYIIPELIGQPDYMDVEDIRSLVDTYDWSLGSHHMVRMDGMTREKLIESFDSKKLWFEEMDISAPDFSYPNGGFGGEILSVIREYYRSGRTIIEYPEAYPPGDPYLIKVLNLVPPVDFEYLQERLVSLSPKGELLVLVLHRIEEVSEYETELSIEDFTKICTLVAQSGRQIKTMEEVSAAFKDEENLIRDWYAPTLFQPTSSSGVQPAGEKTNLSWADRLNATGAGHPEANFNTQLDFSLDWKMVWGIHDGNPQYYNQLEDLYIYVQQDLSEAARLYASVGMEEVNFDDLTEGSLDGSQYYLNSLYLDQTFTDDYSLRAGYFSPDPHHKWLQVSRSVKIEPAFAQDMTPQYLWLQGEWTGYKPFGLKFAFVPDVIGKDVDDFNQRVLTYDEGEDLDDDGNPEYLGVLNLFTSIWYDTKWLDGEVAMALNGDALKLAAEGAINLDAKVVRLAGSLGVKYTRGENCLTYPTWEHEHNAWRYSTGLAGYLVLGDFTFNPGYAYQMYINGEGTIRHLYGLDVGFLYGNTEFYSVLTFFNLTDPSWGVDAGFEIGYAVDFKGVKFVTGYTMGGFSANSGLYGNTDDVEGGVDGLFLRIKATYW